MHYPEPKGSGKLCIRGVIWEGWGELPQQQRARDLSNLKVENYGMTYRRQFEFIAGNTLFKENSNFIY